jgi:hypothetical protein
MIDHIALAIGHGLMAIALLRLVMRAGLDDDPLIGELKSEAEEKRKANSSAGRNAARKADLDDDSDAKANDAHPGSKAAAHKSPGSIGAAVAHKNA